MTSSTVSAEKKGWSTYRLVTMALFAALLCISAYISIPLPLPGAPHITLLNFVILLIALLFPPLDAFLIILVWMILGAVGLPVFIAGRSGIGYLLTPYGGYTVAFPLIALILPAMRGKTYSRLRYTAAAIAGAVIIDLFGMIWLMAATKIDLGTALLTGFVDFLPLDLIKAFVAAQIVPAFLKVMRSSR